jgi:hypothetical protein
LDDVEFVLLFIGPVGPGGRLGGCRAAAIAREDSVPLGQLASNTAENGWCNQILVAAGFATNESIEKTIVESGKKRRSETAAGKEGVRRSFSFTVYKDLSAISVRAHQYGIIVYLFLCQTGLAVDDLQESVGDAVCEADKLDLVTRALPVREECQNEAKSSRL